MLAKVLTGFTNLTDGDLDTAVANAVTSLDKNPNFTLGTTFTQFSEAAMAYHVALGALVTGGKPATVAKDDAREVLEALFTQVAIMVNQQAAGDVTMLLSSGIKQVAAREHHQQPMPVNLQVKNGDNGAMILSVLHSPVGDHGTLFAYTPATNLNTDPNSWTMKNVNGHKATLTGLTPGVSYRFTAAYKGTDDDVPVWAPPISKIVSD
ncbi:MAG: hypothetical protein INR73_29175 [Williamsia sp.]|nr:hypothetical protein [Williamsia sp.]